MNNKLSTCRVIRQTLEQGQNRLRYALELKERVIMNTEQNGAAKIQEDTENLRTEFEKLLSEVEEVRLKLASRATSLEELNKTYRLLVDWIEEIEGKVQSGDTFKNDLSEKRALLEKHRIIQRDIQNHSEIVDRLKSKLIEDSGVFKEIFDVPIVKYEELNKRINHKIKASLNHEIFLHLPPWIKYALKIHLKYYLKYIIFARFSITFNMFKNNS